MLAGAGLGDHPLLAHPQRQQCLPECVVDLVRPGVVKVFALQPDLRSAGAFAKPSGMVERRGAAHVIGQQSRQLCLKLGVGAGLVVLGG